MFTVELKFSVDRREVSPDRFARLFLLDVLREAQNANPRPELRSAPAVPTSDQQQPPKKQPRVVSIPEAARLLGISSATVRSYLARRMMVHIGRRVLVPMAAIERIIDEGLRPARR
jgi:hypothetical protein